MISPNPSIHKPPPSEGTPRRAYRSPAILAQAARELSTGKKQGTILRQAVAELGEARVGTKLQQLVAELPKKTAPNPIWRQPVAKLPDGHAASPIRQQAVAELDETKLSQPVTEFGAIIRSQAVSELISEKLSQPVRELENPPVSFLEQPVPETKGGSETTILAQLVRELAAPSTPLIPFSFCSFC